MYSIKIKSLFLFYIILYFFVINNIWSFLIKGIAYLKLLITNDGDMQNFNVYYFMFGFIIIVPLSALIVSTLFKTVKKNEKKLKDGIIKKWQYYVIYIINIVVLILFFGFFWNEILGILAYQFNIFNGILYYIGIYFIIPCFAILVCFFSFRLISREYFPNE